MAHAGPALLALLVLGCSHAEPFAVSDPAEDGPFAPGAVVRLTYGSGISPAAWLPNGDTLVLAARDEDRNEGRRTGLPIGDVCLFLLPAAGGSRAGEYCSATSAQADSLETFGSPAVSAARALAFKYFHQRLGGSTFGSIRTASLDPPFVPAVVSPLPFSFGNRLIQDASDLAWQPDGSLVFVGWTDEVLERFCDGSPCDILVRIPFGVFRIAPGGGAPATVPGTYLATSAAPDGQGGLLATFPASDQLWRISPAGDSVAVHDFGPGSLVRDAHQAAGRVIVVAGGDARAELDDIGMIQRNIGFGSLLLLDLLSGTASAVGPAGMEFRDPVLSPDGRAVVAISVAGDLWRIDLP